MDNIISKIFDDGMFSNIIFVGENPVLIKSTKIQKINNEIIKTEISNKYELEIHKLKNPTEINITQNIIENFISKIDYRWINSEINYFDRNIFKRILKRENYQTIVNKIKSHEWIITNQNIINELEKSPDFIIINGKTNIKLVGKINNTLIYLNPIDNNNTIYLGNKDSITPIFNKNIDQNIQYIFNINETINKIIVT
jgi:hypothetical protein